MLRQEINLYRQFTAPVTDATYFTWKRYWLLNIIFAIIMVVVFIASMMQTIYLRHEADTLQVKIAHFKEDFTKLKSSFPQLFFSENIGDSVSSLKRQMDAQQKIISILSKHSPFSGVLQGLSRSIIRNVWLNSITISKSGEMIVLDGHSIGMSNINDYINALNNDKSFDQYTVVVNEVKNMDVHDPNIRLTFQINMAMREHE